MIVVAIRYRFQCLMSRRQMRFDTFFWVDNNQMIGRQSLHPCSDCQTWLIKSHPVPPSSPFFPQLPFAFHGRGKLLRHSRDPGRHLDLTGHVSLLRYPWGERGPRRCLLNSGLVLDRTVSSLWCLRVNLLVTLIKLKVLFDRKIKRSAWPFSKWAGL